MLASFKFRPISTVALLLDEVKTCKKMLDTSDITVEHYRLALGVEDSASTLVLGILEGDIASAFGLFAIFFDDLTWTMAGGSGDNTPASVCFMYKGKTYSVSGNKRVPYMMLECMLGILNELEIEKKKLEEDQDG